MYLNLLEKTLCNWIYGDASHPSYGDTRFSPSRREVGRDLPVEAHSMIGLRRLMHLRWAAETVLAEGVGGDFIEAGVWRGGACVLMRGVLAAHGVRDRRVFVADSFAGLPPPDPRHAKDLATVHSFHGRPELAVGLEEVRNNFRSYELLDDQVVFVPGWFKDTLTCIPTMRLAILRIDGDLYASTMDTLEALYDKLSIGGFLICDDYGVVVDARRAILDFRMARGITTPMSAVDGDAIFWRKDR
jgi:O-methyltransferase/8-demethyl-8-(2,3-dimethoxy-alpha-L-rhamnosyl)tetracenomycin-C 4'-O-methyltransferase